MYRSQPGRHSTGLASKAVGMAGHSLNVPRSYLPLHLIIVFFLCPQPLNGLDGVLKRYRELTPRVKLSGKSRRICFEDSSEFRLEFWVPWSSLFNSQPAPPHCPVQDQPPLPQRSIRQCVLLQRACNTTFSSLLVGARQCAALLPIFN